MLCLGHLCGIDISQAMYTKQSRSLFEELRTQIFLAKSISSDETMHAPDSHKNHASRKHKLGMVNRVSRTMQAHGLCVLYY